MSKSIKPSSLDGIRRLAKTIKAESSIHHIEALDVASRAAEYENYAHARKSLLRISREKPVCKGVFLTAYWRDTQTNETGRETLNFPLKVLWGELISQPQFKINRGLADFRASGPDHLEYRYSARSQSKARQLICAASRNLQFMQATGLRPTTSRKVYPRSQVRNVLPGADHSSGWYDPITKKYLFITEPFSAGYINQEKLAWAKRHVQDIAISSWPGMYNPPGSSLCLTSDLIKGIPLGPILSALEKLPPPLLEENWNGQSMPFSAFVSPGSLAKDKASREKLKANPPRIRTGPRTTLGYIGFSGESYRRPKGQLTLELHAEIGRLITSVLADTLHRNSVTNRLEEVRKTLEEWVWQEHANMAFSKKVMESIYFHHLTLNFIDTIDIVRRKKHVESLEKIVGLLTQHYPECPPLNVLLKKLTTAIIFMESWKPSRTTKSFE